MAIDNVTGTESVEELQRLYALFENRMKILDEKKSFTKPEIYQKVRAEYEAKLVELQVLLEEKGVGMQEALDASVAERDQLVARTHEIKDQLDEMELRAVIGEIDENTFAAKQQELQDESAAIDAQLQDLSTKIENYQRLIGGQAPQPAAEVEVPMAAEPAPQPEPEPEAPPAPAPRPVVPRPAAPAPQPRPVAQPPAAAPHPASAPRPVQPPAPAPKPAPAVAPRPAAPPAIKPAPAPVAEPKPTPPPPAPRPAPAPKPAPVQPAAPAAPPASTEMDELEKQFASILSSTMADTAALEKPSMGEVFTQQMPDVAEQPQAAESLPEALASESPAAEEGGEDSHEGELKCPKCGAFNRADNWYCEKCGNELLNASDLLGGTK